MRTLVRDRRPAQTSVIAAFVRVNRIGIPASASVAR